MTLAPAAVVDWSRAIRPIWAARLAFVSLRHGSDTDLPEAWRQIIVSCRDHGWQLRAVAPLEGDPMGHRWTIVIGRGQENVPPNLVLIHGMTAADALRRGVAALEAGLPLPV